MAPKPKGGVATRVKRDWWAFLVPSLILLLAVGLRLANSPLLEEAQLRVFDAFQRMRPRTYREAPVRIVDIDDESLARLGQWPWPRTLIARLVRRLSELGAAVIVFDIVFAEPDRTSPLHVLPLWPATPAIEALRANPDGLPDHDHLLAQAIAEARVVTAFTLTHQPGTRVPVRKAGFSYGGDDPRIYLPIYPGAVVNLEELEAQATGNGSFTILPDRDGIIRRIPLLFRLRDTLYPSLAAEALRVAQGASAYGVKSSGASGEIGFGAHTGITHVKVGQFVMPTDREGRLWLSDTGYVPARFLPAWRILSDDSPPDVEGHIVLVGTSAAGLKDIRATPLNAAVAGVEVHAQLIEQSILQDFLRRPDWADGAELLYVLVLGILLIVALPRLGPAWCALFGGVALAIVCGLSWHAFTAFQWLIDPVFPSVVTFLIYLVASLMSFLHTEAERRQVRQAFSRYLSPVLVQRLAESPQHLALGGELRNLTLLFADIRGFTTISEQFNPQELTHFINRFLTPMTDLIMKRSGTIDKYMGDCIMAFWNAPLDDPDHPRHACQAALDMRSYLVQWNKELKAEAEAAGKPFYPIHIGIGLNTGDCCVGNLGSDQRFEYSVLGDAVNLASRLEGQCKIYNADVVIGQSVCDRVSEFAAIELDLVKVKGKTKPVRIFGLLGDPEFNAGDGFRALAARHQEMLGAYRAQRWDEAGALIEECLTLDTPRTRLRILYALYKVRIESFRATPPPPDWDGSHAAATK
jgi:adenylate cyclase